METLNQLFIIIFSGMIGAAIVCAGEKKREMLPGDSGSLRDRGASGERLWFWGLMALALLLRFWEFGSIPGGMNQDGAMAAVDARALASFGTDRYGMRYPVHFTAWGYGQMSVLLSYCMIPFIKIFGLNAWAVRLPMLLVSMAGLGALYAVGRRLMGEKGALILLAFGVCNPWHFMQSRWALDCNMLPHIFLIGFALLLKGLQEKKRWLYLSMLCFGLCMYCYGVAFYTVTVFLVVLCIYLLVKKLVTPLQALWCAGIYLLTAWPICLTMAINAFGGTTIRTPLFTIPYFPGSVRSHDILFFADDFFGQLKENWEHLVRLYCRGDNLPWNTIEGFGAVTYCFLPFVFLGVWDLGKRFFAEKDGCRKGTYFAVLLWFLVGNLGGLITARVNVNRGNLLLYPLILLGGWGIRYVVRAIRILGWGILGAYALISILFLHSYFTSQAQLLDHYFYKDFLEAVEYAGKETNCREYVITPDSQYKGSGMVSEILTLFALDVDARLYQGITRQDGLTYEEIFHYVNWQEVSPNPQYPTAYVIKSVELEEFPGEGYVYIPFGSYVCVVPEKWY